MLAVDNGENLIDELWETLAAKVELPESLKSEYFSVRGAEPVFHDNRRSYHRYYMRGQGCAEAKRRKLLGIYTKDVSRQGVAFLSPVPLLPKERVKLQLPTIELSLEVTRCRRIEAACFECGGKFAL